MSLIDHALYHGGFGCSKPLKVRVVSAGGAVVKYQNGNRIEAISDSHTLKQFVIDTLGLDDLVRDGLLEIFPDALSAIDSKDATPESRGGQGGVLEAVYERYNLTDGTIVLYGTDDAIPLANHLHFAIPPRNPLDLVGSKNTFTKPNGTKPVIVVSSQAVPTYLEAGKFRPIPSSDGPLSMALAIAYIAQGEGHREAGLVTDHTRLLIGPRTEKRQEVLPVFSALDSEALAATFTGDRLSIDYVVEHPKTLDLSELESFQDGSPLFVHNAYTYAPNVLAITHPSQMQFVTNWALTGLFSKHRGPEGQITEIYSHEHPRAILYQMNGIRPNLEHERILLGLQDKGHHVYLVPGTRIPPDARDPAQYPVADSLSKIPIVYTTLEAATAKACAALALTVQAHHTDSTTLMSTRMTQLMTGAWGSEILR
ncbi:MAG: hypothetical protein AABX70_04500 [Nanoarchaeota archaeon]